MRDSAETNAIAFSPDGTKILTGGTDGAARLWDVATGKPIGAPMQHRQRINTVAFSPDALGQFLLIGCADGSARIWDAATRKPLGPPLLQSRPLMTATFLPDGNSFLTTAADGQTRRWDVPMPLKDGPDQLALRLQVHTGLEIGPGQTLARLASEEWRDHAQKLDAAEGSVRVLDDRQYHDGFRARDDEQGRWPLLRCAWHPRSADCCRCRAFIDWLRLCARALHGWELDGQRKRADADCAEALKRGSSADLLRWYQYQALECRKSKRWPIALAYLDRALALDPNGPSPLMPSAFANSTKSSARPRIAKSTCCVAVQGADSIFLARLADEHASRGQWENAKAALALADERGPTSLSVKHRLALALLKTSDPAGYRRICARALEGVAQGVQETGIGYANKVAWLCALGPDAVDDFSQPIALAEKALADARPQARPDVLNTLGAVLFRASRYKDAIARLEESIQLRKGPGVVHDWVFLCMAHHRLDEFPEARKYLREIEARQSNPPMGWERLEVDLLCNEAKALASRAGR